MSARVVLYNSVYANYGSDVYRQVRTETYGQDFGKTSWVTMEESNKIPQCFVWNPIRLSWSWDADSCFRLRFRARAASTSQ